MEAINSLGINAKLLIAQIINFLVLLFLLKKFLYGPIVKMLDRRSLTIKKSLDDAKKIEEELKETEEKNQQLLAETREEAKKIIEEAKASAANESKRMVEDAAKQAESQKTKALEEIRQEKEAAKSEIKKEAATLVALASQKVLEMKIDEKTDRAFIESSLKEVE